VLSASEFFAMYREVDQLHEPDPQTQGKNSHGEQINLCAVSATVLQINSMTF